MEHPVFTVDHLSNKCSLFKDLLEQKKQMIVAEGVVCFCEKVSGEVYV